MKYQVEWMSHTERVHKVHGIYNTFDEAMQSIKDWWNKNDYKPSYIIYHTTEDGLTTIDYGLHYSFYYIREVESLEEQEYKPLKSDSLNSSDIDKFDPISTKLMKLYNKDRSIKGESFNSNIKSWGRNEKTYTSYINNLILEGKEKGFSTKGISDKWHTFDELYYHRMILTLCLAKLLPNHSWKSKLHHDGTMFDDSFIVGFNTPEGQYSYHYNLKYWDMFDIKELEHAPEYDGHKPKDITRLLSILN